MVAAFSFKIKYGIYHVLQNSWSCNCTFFCHVTDNKNGYAHTFCDLHQNIRGFSYLRNASRCRRDIFMKHGLNRIYNCHIRFRPFNDLTDILQISLTQKFQFIIKTSKSVRPQLNLAQ